MAPEPQPAPVILFTFDRADEAAWDVGNDGVMGGRSAGFVAKLDDLRSYGRADE